MNTDTWTTRISGNFLIVRHVPTGQEQSQPLTQSGSAYEETIAIECQAAITKTNDYLRWLEQTIKAERDSAPLLDWEYNEDGSHTSTTQLGAVMYWSRRWFPNEDKGDLHTTYLTCARDRYANDGLRFKNHREMDEYILFKHSAYLRRELTNMTNLVKILDDISTKKAP